MCYHAKFGDSVAMSPIAESTTEYFAPVVPGELGAHSLIIFKLAHY